MALTNSRLTALDDAGVAIRHKERASGRWPTTRLTGHEFMRRFLQHVLPKGFHKVRYFGLWHPSRRADAARVRLHLDLDRPAPAQSTSADAPGDAPSSAAGSRTPERDTTAPIRVCPHCEQGRLVVVGRLYPKQASGP